MKILKTKDSEIMNLYFHEQLKKQASAASTITDPIWHLIKTMPGISSLEDLAKALGVDNIDELVGVTGKSKGQLEADMAKYKAIDVGNIPTKVKPLAGAVVNNVSQEFGKHLKESLDKILPLLKESESLLAATKNIDSLDDQAIRLLKQNITNNKDEIMREYTPLRARFEVARSAGGFELSEISGRRAELKKISDKAKELDIAEQKLIEKIKTPNASSIVEAPKVDVSTAKPATEIKTPDAAPTLTNIKPFNKPKPLTLTPESKAIKESVVANVPAEVQKHIDAAMSSAKASVKFIDPETEAKITKIIKEAYDSGVKSGGAEAIEKLANQTETASLKIMKKEAKALENSYRVSISELSPELQKIVEASADSAKLSGKDSIIKTTDGMVAAEEQAFRESEIKKEPEAAMTPEIKPKPGAATLPGTKPKVTPEAPKVPESPKPTPIKGDEDTSLADKLKEQKLKKDIADLDRLKFDESFVGGLYNKFKTGLQVAIVGVVGSIGLAIWGIPATMAAGAAAIATAASGSILPLVGIIAAIGGAYYIYNNWIVEEPNIALVAKLHSKLADAYVRFVNAKFKEDTEGHALFQEISTVSARLMKYGLTELSKPSESDKDLSMVFSDIDLLKKDLKKFLSNKDKYCQDLVNPNDCDDLTASAQGLYETLNEYTSSVSDYIKEHADDTTEEASAGGITSQVGSAAKSDSQQQSDRTPYEVQIYDQNVDIAHLSGNMRMSAPRIIGKVFNTPEGMAFIDPANKFGGGFFGRTSEPGKDYLEALKYFYLNRIFDKHDLKKFIRANLPTASRRKMGNYKEGLDYYKQNPFSAQKIRRKRLQKQESLKNLHKNFTKSANVSMLVDKSGNSMKKQADQFSKEYFKDAVKSISEQYSKSYYEGFGKLYDVTPEKTSADYQQLYQNHQESGTDLIERAHPKSIYIADAISNGGLIENSIEQHRKMEEVAFSMPSGNFRNRYAELIENLVKIANESDEQGLYQSSELIEESVTKLIGNLK